MADQDDVIDAARHAAGWAILELTDRVGFQACTAAWMYDRSTDLWRYVLVTPMAATRGPRWVYDRLVSLFRHYGLPAGVSLADISVIDPAMEAALFGEATLAGDVRPDAPPHAVPLDEAPTGAGFAVFYRRLPVARRGRGGDPAHDFDLRVRRLDRAA